MRAAESAMRGAARVLGYIVNHARLFWVMRVGSVAHSRDSRTAAVSAGLLARDWPFVGMPGRDCNV